MGLMEWYFTLRHHFGGEAEMKITMEKLQERLEGEQLHRALVQQQLRDFKQDVASVLPDLAPEDRSEYSVRNLASIVTAPDLEHFSIERAASLFEHGKASFKEGDYEKSNAAFRRLVQQYPDSTHVIESYFLYAEGTYQESDYEECLKTVDTMVSLFPENDLTGFSLLRMGQILSARDRVEDAEQIYRTVIENFKNTTLSDQAHKLLKEIVL